MGDVDGEGSDDDEHDDDDHDDDDDEDGELELARASPRQPEQATSKAKLCASFRWAGRINGTHPYPQYRCARTAELARWQLT